MRDGDRAFPLQEDRMPHPSFKNIRNTLLLTAVAASALVYAQQTQTPPAGTAAGRGAAAGPPYTGSGPGGSARVEPGANLMSNPYRLVENWPTLNPGMKWGAAINFIPDNKGGTWVLLRTEPPIVYFDASGKIVQSMGQGMFTSGHGMCRDSDGNFWAADNPFGGAATGRGFQVFKFSPQGKLLLTLGQAGVSKAGPDTFVGPTACVQLPNGDMLIADGHWPRPAFAQQDGDRLVRYTKEGKYVRDYGKLGSGAGEFAGPHAMAIDSQGRIFVADRSNNRLQIFDKDMNYLDSWKHFGRPSGITILKDDTLVVADSESGVSLAGPPTAPEKDNYRNVGWKQGIRIGSARDGRLTQFIEGTNPEGMGADEQGNIFAGLTGGIQVSKSGGAVQKWIRK
jgi:sugar lactone lactonase YvrE